MKRQPMTPDDRVLYEAERWFRAFLRGDRALRDTDVPLFTAMAERQNTQAAAYLPREAKPAIPIVEVTGGLSLTLPPPSAGAQRDWIRITRGANMFKPNR